MSLPSHLNDREYGKFEEIGPGIWAVRVSGANFSGTFTFSGLRNGGKVTEVTLYPDRWVPIPATALTDRNAMGIQNVSGEEMKVNFRDDVGYVGMVIGAGSERTYDISDQIIVYGRSIANIIQINVEELS